MTMGFDFKTILEEEPRATFFSFQNQFGQSPNQRRYFQNQFQNIHNEYLGTIGSAVRRGETPTLRFGNFLENLPFTERYTSLPPSLRGDFKSQFAPRTRFLFGF